MSSGINFWNCPDVKSCNLDAAAQIAVPDGFNVHPKLLPQLQKRVEMLNDGTIDWSMGETLAFGSLLLEGRPIRLAGQDSRRGTFSNRHAATGALKFGSTSGSML